MISRTLLMIALSAVSVSAAPVPKELKRPTEIERMQGVWKEEKGMRWFFDGEKLHVGGTDTTGNKGKSYALTLRPGGEVGEIDFGGGQEFQYYAIYQLLGDELRLAYFGSGGKRPNDFTARPGEFHHVLKRLAEGEK